MYMYGGPFLGYAFEYLPLLIYLHAIKGLPNTFYAQYFATPYSIDIVFVVLIINVFLALMQQNKTMCIL